MSNKMEFDEFEDERVPRIPRIYPPRIRFKTNRHLEDANEAISKENNFHAINCFLQHIDNLADPHDMKLNDQIKLTKLIISLKDLGESEEARKSEEVLKAFLHVLNKYPENALLLNAFGLFFFSQGEYGVSRDYFRKSGAAGYLPGEKNYLHVIWHLIPRWHFRMLNDRMRNESYKKAINKAINEGYKKVYDIGSGCGLLSLIAASVCEDVKVVAFEESKVLYDTACSILRKNRVKGNIRLIHGNSNEVQIPPAPCNLIVTEIFDAGVFGENCLKTIKHAVSTFINEEKYKIIPAGVRLFVTGIQGEQITMKYRYKKELAELQLENLLIIDVDAEPYDAEYLRSKSIKYITNTRPLLNVNFYDANQLNTLLAGDNSFEETEVVCSKAGIIHTFAVWFDLYLDEEVTISTNPSNLDNQCWEQAVIHLDQPLKVKKGDIVKLQPSIVDGQINIKVVNIEIKCGESFRASKEIISFLNDAKLVEGIIKAANSFGEGNLRIFDFNVFPLFGFLMAKRGATVYHVYKDENDLALFNNIMAVNELSSQQLIFIHEKALEDYIILMEPPDLIYTDLIKTDGSWNKEEFTLVTETKLGCDSLPKKILLKAQLINSNYLNFCNKVDDKNALDFKISVEMNEFSGNEHPNLDSLEHKKHSTIVTFDISDLERFDFHAEEMEGKITKGGVCNGILYWFDIQFTDDVNNIFSTLESTHYDKCCTLLKNPKIVKKSDKIMFYVMRHEGHLKVYCD